MKLLAYSAQICILVVAGAVLPRLFRMRAPGPMLIYWQCLLAVCVLLPLFEGTLPAPAGNPAHFTVTAALAPITSPRIRSFFPIALALIGVGSLIRLTWLAAGLWKLTRYRSGARQLTPAPPWMREIEDRLGTRAEVRISHEMTAPASFGRTILLPATWLDIHPEWQRAVVSHELLHVKRRDWPFHLLEEVVRGLFWFHPAVWWLVTRIHLTREQVVDREVLQLAIPRESYMQALLAAARWPLAHAPVPAPCFSRKHELTQRLENIIEEVSMSKRRLFISLTGIAIGLAVAGHFAVWSFPLQSSTGKVYRVGGGVTPPKVLQKTDPAYTDAASKAKIQGTVRLDLEISPEGFAQNIHVVQGLDPGLDENAVFAVRQWRFQPGLKDGEPVTVAAIIEVNFHLK
ncbi:MAG: M56 family metallopeptidase [Acidobacteriota bacterium]|nr:M56 family metallopeptidase [Acidobacteriota bacterium]